MSAVAFDNPAMILAAAARLREDAVKDKTYRLTPIGRLAGTFLDELTFSNYSRKTLDLREQTYAWLALDYAHLEPNELTLDHLRDFLIAHWRDAAANTRNNHISALRVFSGWAHDRGFIHVDIGRKLKLVKVKDTERRSHERGTIRRLVVSQEHRRDKVALLLLYWCGLRRNELRQIQFRHIDLARRMLTVFGKGGKVAEQGIPETVALEIERLIQDTGALPDHFLLYPQKIGRRGSYPHYVDDVIWEKRDQPLSSSGIDKWWQRCVRNAGLGQFPMHEIRHTAGTHFHEESGDLVKTQHFMRHASAETTARVYIHIDRARAVADVQRRMVDPLEDTA